MRIVYLHQYFHNPEMSGGATRSYEMARRLADAGHDVHIITSDIKPRSGARGWHVTTEAGVTVHWISVPYDNSMNVPRRMLAFAKFAALASVRARRLHGDVVFATSTPLTIALPALVATTFGRRPFVFEVRDQWPDVPIAVGALRNPVGIRLARWLEAIAYARARRIVALAPGMREDIMAKGVHGDKIVVIPNGCDHDFFARDHRTSPREEHAWLADRPMVLFAGALGYINGVDYIARLARACIETAPDVCFVVIGDGREKDSLRSLAKRLGVWDRNLFMLGQMPKREVARWLNACDLALALFTGPRIVWKDAVQNKFFDAIAAGKPIANNFDGWQTSIAREAEVGIMLDPDDATSGARAVLALLDDTAWLAGLPSRARELSQGRFSMDRLAADLERVLTDAATRGS